MDDRVIRIFIDTDILDPQWPDLNVDTQNVLTMAQSLGIGITVPTPVLDELNKHGSERIDRQYARLKSALRYFHETLKMEVPAPELNKEQLLASYGKVVSNTFQKWQIESCQITELSAAMVFQQINHGELLDEGGGRHFKDLVIFHSILEDIRGKEIDAVLVSNDQRFKRKEKTLVAFAKANNASISFWDLKDALSKLEAKQKNTTHAKVQQRLKLATEALEAEKATVERMMNDKYSDRRHWSNVNYFRDVRLEYLYDVKVTIPNELTSLGQVEGRFHGTVEAVWGVDSGSALRQWQRVPIEPGLSAYGTFEEDKFVIKSMSLAISHPQHPGIGLGVHPPSGRTF
jgi:hypothetical protein